MELRIAGSLIKKIGTSASTIAVVVGGDIALFLWGKDEQSQGEAPMGLLGGWFFR